MAAAVFESHHLPAIVDHRCEFDASLFAVGQHHVALVGADKGLAEHEVLFDLVDGDQELLLRHIRFAAAGAGDSRGQIGGQQAGGEAGGDQQCGLEGAQVHRRAPVWAWTDLKPQLALADGVRALGLTSTGVASAREVSARRRFVALNYLSIRSYLGIDR